MTRPSPEPDRPFTREQYRHWCETQPGRYERVDGRIVAMAPELGAQLRAKAASYRARRHAIAAAGVDCQALPDGATVETGDSDYEPGALIDRGHIDILVLVNGPIRLDPPGITITVEELYGD